jgi:arginyl-tRNA synthetase
VNCNLPKITYPTLRSLLLLKICEAISLQEEVEVANQSIDDLDFQRNRYDIRLLAPRSTLKRVKSETSVVAYASTIALQLAAKSSTTPTEIADKIIHFLQHSLSNLSGEEIENQLLRDLTVTYLEPGRLVFEFSDRAIAAYLQEILSHCTDEPNRASDRSFLRLKRESSSHSKIFLCQYSYARCAALIRMASRPNHIDKSVENHSAKWLNEGKLLLQKELELLAQIITTLDEWEEKDALTLAIALSEAFQTFYQNCQIVKYDTINLQVAQCRLALVMITHWLLKHLLEQGIGVVAPETL